MSVEKLAREAPVLLPSCLSPPKHWHTTRCRDHTSHVSLQCGLQHGILGQCVQQLTQCGLVWPTAWHSRTVCAVAYRTHQYGLAYSRQHPPELTYAMSWHSRAALTQHTAVWVSLQHGILRQQHTAVWVSSQCHGILGQCVEQLTVWVKPATQHA